ncbi:restriction endonuclease [Magnetofaba australis]|uniref:restriction endonuclease n=1 Tax=Magnetofaba australis TaxID=1472297 RepID=UPI000A19CD12|nr:restriction endonuclease [Magnetofaba australis]
MIRYKIFNWKNWGRMIFFGFVLIPFIGGNSSGESNLALILLAVWFSVIITSPFLILINSSSIRNSLPPDVRFIACHLPVDYDKFVWSDKYATALNVYSDDILEKSSIDDLPRFARRCVLYLIEFLRAKRYKKIEAIVRDNVASLHREMKVSQRTDSYGNIIDDGWSKALSYFYDNVVCRDFIDPATSMSLETIPDDVFNKIAEPGLWITYDHNRNEIIEFIKLIVEDYSRNLVSTNVDVDGLDGFEYEYYCSDRLKENGWEASVTQASADQGVDVIATYNGKRVAIQCKKYSSPVGNKAVQEVHTAKAHYDTQFAIVMSNAGYTRAAKELAQTSGVFLTHHDDIPILAQMLGLEAAT